MSNNVTELAQQMADTLGATSGSQSTVFQALHELQFASSLFLQHEQLRLEAIDSEHPDVQQLQARRNQLLAQLPDIQGEQEKSCIQVPTFDSGTEVLVHGRVYDAELRGFRDIELSFTDENDVVQAAMGNATTNTCGYFALIVLASVAAAVTTENIILRAKTPDNRLVGQVSLSKEDFQAGAMLVREFMFDRQTVEEEGSSSPVIPTWHVEGNVSTTGSSPLENKIVRLLKRSDATLLSSAVTDSEGNYTICYQPDNVQEAPPVDTLCYLAVYDPSDLVTAEYSTSAPNDIPYQPGQTVTVDMQYDPV